MGNQHNNPANLNQKSQKFYTDLSRVNTVTVNNPDDLSEKIQLRASINQIKKGCEYQIQLFSLEGPQMVALNGAERCQSTDGITAYSNSPILIRYYFEKEQPLLAKVTRIESGTPYEFEIRTTLGCVMGSRKNTLQRKISETENELLFLQGEKLKQSEDVLSVKFEIRPTKTPAYAQPKSKIYYEIYAPNLLYRSEYLNNNGQFSPVKIPADIVKGNINLKFFDFRRKVVGNFNTNTSEFTSGKTFAVKVNRNTYNITSKSIITKNYTFVDYLKAGVEIGLSVAIDFTGSNGNPKDPKSLHFINGMEPNQYERAIGSCGNIVAYYDYDQLFPCFGFGARINGQPTPLFNLNFQQDPNINMVENIIGAYHNAINVVQLWGPTNFGPIIRAMNEIIKSENNKLKYHILMILTDGMIDDIDATIEELVEGSFLPLSVIIIGVGRADFSSMNVLDADDNPLVNSKGTRAARDLVQFVPFLKYESNPEKLASEVLYEIPGQILEYYEQNNLDPQKLVS